MYARVVLGVGKGVLFREVSSVQECPHREREREREREVTLYQHLPLIHMYIYAPLKLCIHDGVGILCSYKCRYFLPATDFQSHYTNSHITHDTTSLKPTNLTTQYSGSAHHSQRPTYIAPGNHTDHAPGNHTDHARC